MNKKIKSRKDKEAIALRNNLKKRKLEVIASLTDFHLMVMMPESPMSLKYLQM